ncbi:MAG: hypothetical protein WCG83_00270 [Candidatus Peregrinibacteria bacterium]
MPSFPSIESNIDYCRALWDEFSPRRSLYELWEFRMPFYEVYGFAPAFVVLPDKGMVPLWFHPEQKRYLWFGDTGDEFNWQEDNAFWVRESCDIEELLSHLPRPCLLNSCAELLRHQIGERAVLTSQNSKSVLSLSAIGSVDDYLMTLPKKLRSNVRHDQRVITAQSPIISENHLEDLDAMIGWNRAKFTDSPWHDEKMLACLRKLVDPTRPKPYKVHVLSVRIGGVLAAVDCAFSWNSIFYPLFCGSDVQRFPGIGHFMNLLDIQFALDHQTTSLDFSEVEPETVKAKLFPTVPQYTLRLE